MMLVRLLMMVAEVHVVGCEWNGCPAVDMKGPVWHCQKEPPKARLSVLCASVTVYVYMSVVSNVSGDGAMEFPVNLCECFGAVVAFGVNGCFTRSVDVVEESCMCFAVACVMMSRTSSGVSATTARRGGAVQRPIRRDCFRRR